MSAPIPGSRTKIHFTPPFVLDLTALRRDQDCTPGDVRVHRSASARSLRAAISRVRDTEESPSPPPAKDRRRAIYTGSPRSPRRAPDDPCDWGPPPRSSIGGTTASSTSSGLSFDPNSSDSDVFLIGYPASKTIKVVRFDLPSREETSPSTPPSCPLTPSTTPDSRNGFPACGSAIKMRRHRQRQ